MTEESATAPLPSASEAYDLSEAFSVARLGLRLPSGVEHVPGGDRIGIGAHPANTIVTNEPGVSRFHCEIQIDGEAIRVVDLGSLNGTYVDDVRVERAWLRGGNRLRLGDLELVVFVGDATEQVPLHGAARFGAMVGRSVPMRRSFEMLDRLARSELSLLIEGESGTGKDLAAEGIHARSARAEGALVIVDCGTLSRNLMSSELFGHEAGAFTGAVEQRRGAFEQANGGTVFLDEIGELPLDVQPALLRVLERRTIRRLGSSGTIPVDVRVVAATNRALRAEVNAGRFRPDLYHRLAEATVRLPPLRERLDDLPMLTEELLRDLDAPETLRRRMLSEPALARLGRHHWPGNVRELRNVLMRAIAFDEDLPVCHGALPDIEVELPEPGLGWTDARAIAIGAFERRWLRRLMEEHDGNVTRAARAAGLARQYLHELLRRHALRGPAQKD